MIKGPAVTDVESGQADEVPITSSGFPLTHGLHAFVRSEPRDCRFLVWFYALPTKALLDTHSTVSHFPVGMEHLDNTIETDRLSRSARVCGRNKDWMLAFSLCQCTVVPPVETKEERCSAIPVHQPKSSNDAPLCLVHRNKHDKVDHVMFSA